MKLNQEGWCAQYYINFYRVSHLPGNLCSYFWKLLLAIIPFGILFWPAVVINLMFTKATYHKSDNTRYPSYYIVPDLLPTAIGIILNILIMVIGYGFTHTIYGSVVHQMSFIKLYGNGVLFFFIFLIVGILIFYSIFGLSRLFTKLFSKENTKEEFDEVNWAKEYEAKMLKQLNRKKKWKQSFIYLCCMRIRAWKEDHCPIIEWESKN